MNYKMMSRFLSQILAVEAVFMIPSLAIGFYDRTYSVVKAFLISILLMLAVAGLFALYGRRAPRGFFAKEGLFCVGISWILMSLFGCLPFCLSGEIPHFVDALFEIVSGFTTTGASVVSDIEALSRATLYWRSFSHWVGGMGVLVFLLALIPAGGKSEGFTMHLLRAESPGPNVGKLVPKMRQTAAVLYVTYLALTLLNLVFLLIGDMPFFEALCTAFGTAGTGGFGIKNDSMASCSPYLQNVTTVFMLLFGINFGCYYLLLLRRVADVFGDEELRLYVGIVVSSVLLISLNIRGLYDTIWDALRHAAFQVSSIITTTGFSTTDFDLWPSFSKGILLTLMMIGACAGSTGGGIKCARILLLIKGVKRNIAQVLNPRRVEVIRMNGRTVDERISAGTNAYLCAYALILVVSFLLLSADGFSVMTNFSAVLACFNNIGPGFEAVGPACNFSLYSVFSKLVLIVDMLAGRLEIFPILVLFSARTWKSNR
ncbi:MAG: TrkH family potassium uptake protein [Ruminococcaceae bacterium]|nr:TrkH family potassium uptake protein [Oscillospiraceae bacterium]